MGPMQQANCPTPPWMSTVLIAAATYNFLWGLSAAIWPNATFTWADMPVPNYPQLWQCIGMIVGVYGVGYGIAATNPARHWPIVLVGLLGKVLGPIGMVQGWWSGQFTADFTLTSLTNDVIWWVPFALILHHAWEQFRQEGSEGLPEESALLRVMTTSTGESLASLSQQKPVLLVLLRHEGCTFCRNAMSDISRLRPKIEGSGTEIVLAHMDTPTEFLAFAERYGLASVPAVSDPDRLLYRGLGLKRARLLQLIGPRVLWRWLQAALQGHAFGAIKGDAAQMPGAFLLHNGHVVRRHEYRDAGDKPDYLALATLPRSFS